MTTLLIQKGRVFDGEKFIWADVLIRGGKIEAIAPNIREKADRIIDASGMTVLPGLVDVHLHMQGISSPGW